jgi:hypothetical protein
MSAIINNYRQLDVAFLLLNDLTTKLRTAGARISVRKVGNFHRITVLKEPTVASIEQILSYTSAETETPNLNSNTSPSESTPSPDETFSEAGGNTVLTVNEDIEDNSVVKAIAPATLSESTSSPDESHTDDSKVIISENTAEIITDSTDSPTPDNSSSKVTNIPDSPDLASLEDLQTLTLKRLRELAKLHKVPGFSRMKEEKLVTKLHGLATKEKIV